ncbi:MAG: HAMP domain-containing sensor histidine kinase [Syntrophomonadaceae bacterium]|nr:HAMP domain-containing sensor histidine kinase [Syntrophomonadaceae bacterium]
MNRSCDMQLDCIKANLIMRTLRILAESKDAENAYYSILKEFKMDFPDYGFELCLYETDSQLKVFSFKDELPFSYIIDSEYSRELFAAIKYKTNIYRSIISGVNHPEDEQFYQDGFQAIANIPVTGLYKGFALARIALPTFDKDQEFRAIVEIIEELALAMETFIYREKLMQINSKVAAKEKNILLNKFALIGEMSKSIAHEVRNPMTTVKGLAQLLSSENPQNRKYYNLMIEEIDRANKIISDFLSLSADSFACNEIFSITELLDGIIDLTYRRIVKQKVNIILNVDLESIEIFGNREQLKQAFINILNNALDVSVPGNTIKINVGIMDEQVFISFIDQGPGIDDITIDHIIEPFFTTKDNNAGLGLSVSYKIIKDHGGEIMINSQLDKGTTIEICLPLVQR